MKSDKLYPLTSVQKEIWFDQVLNPDIPIYNIGGYVKIDGPVEPAVFERAARRVVKENDALRIILREKDPLPLQEFAETVNLNVEFHDFSDKEDAMPYTLEWMNREFIQPFELYDRHLFEFALIKVSDNCFCWFKKYHHLITDGWGISIIVRRVAEAYNEIISVKEHPAHDEIFSYKNFITDDLKYIDSKKFQSHKEYWTDKYASASDSLIPTHYGYDNAESRLSKLWLNRDVYNRMAAFAKKNRASTFHFILGAMYVYFLRTSGAEDFVIGLPVLNRSSKAFKNTVGLFVWVCPAKFSFGSDITFARLIKKIGKELRKDYRNKRFPVSEINRAAGIRKQGKRQLFDLLLSYEKHDYTTNFDGHQAVALPLLNKTDRNSLSVYIREFHEDRNVRIDFSYNCSAFSDAEITLLQARFAFLFEEVLQHPDIPVRQLEIMPENERHQILFEFNDTKADYPKDKCIHHLFEAQVEKKPDAIAVVFEDKQLTYQELNEHANRLGHYLQKLGVGPEVLVGICIERSIEMVIGLLGILKAGGAYLPLDPTYPQERLAFMMEDTQTSILLTQTKLLDSLPERKGKLVCLDTNWEAIIKESGENVKNNVKPDNLIYIIYTSGTTGIPKSVSIWYKSFINLINWFVAKFELDDKDSNLVISSLSFELTQKNIFVPLVTGGTLNLISQYDPEVILNTAAENNVTWINCTPGSFYPLLFYSGAFKKLHSLRYLFFIGESMSLPPLEKWIHSKEYNAKIINTYGHTESCIAAYYPLVNPENYMGWESIPAGKPAGNVKLYVLDKYLNPVPVGVAGEVCIGGSGIARGYTNDSELTAEKFIPDPFIKQAQRRKGTEAREGFASFNYDDSRLYKTGDLCRYLPDGNIEFLGRIDNQVKIRGFRVEPGEIKAILSKHEQVKEAVVIAIEDRSDNKQLVAYFTLKEEEKEPEPGKLRKFLKAKLPDYMIPAFFIFMDTLPLTPNGKIDCKALPTPDISSLQKEYTAPRTDTEKQIATVFKSVLKLEKVGIFDNFFDLGGHSLLATVVISRMREIFEIDIPIRSLFEFPVINEFGYYIENRLLSEGIKEYISIKPVSRTEPLLLSFAQQRLWFLDKLEQGKIAAYNIPMYIRVKGSLDLLSLKKTVNEIVRRHEILRTVLKESVDRKGTSKEPVQVILPELTIEIPLIDISCLDEKGREKKAAEIAEKQALKPFDLSKGPLIRAGVIKLDHADNILSVNVHHIAFDGWSAGVFFEEFKALYEAFLKGLPSLLPDPDIQYADFAKWQRYLLSGEIYGNHLLYWKEKLDAAPSLLELPTDRPRPKTQTFKGCLIRFEIEKDLANRLKDLTKESGGTIFMTLFAAFSVLLSKYSGREDIIIGSPIANRNHKQIEPLIGFFVNTLALRADLSENPKFTDFLSQIKNTTLNAYEHQDIPFEKLVDELDIERSLSHSPLFQVMFAFQNTPMENFDLPGLEFTRFEFEYKISKFDLTLNMGENNGIIEGAFEYNTDLFNRTTIERMTAHFITLLKGISVNPEQKISDIPMLTDEERHKILIEWNDTNTNYPKDKCIHQLFEVQAENTPDAVAIVFEDEQLTYKELNERANQLGHYLQKQGVGPEVLVGICMERSIEMIAGLLGILKAGGAYVPLDPAYPWKRLAYMLEDTQAPVLLTQEKFLSSFSESKTVPLCSDIDWKSIDMESKENVTNNLKPDNLAYVIYTSGSTGTPKGVAVPHRAIVRLVKNTNYIEVEPEDRIAHASNIAFDAATFEMWGALANGAAIVVIERETALSPSKLIGYISEMRISIMFLTTVLFNQISEQEPAAFAGLRYLLFGGEAVNSGRVKRVLDTAPPVNFLHVYGPTETTTFASWHKISDVPESAHTVPIGIPLANTCCYVLDKNRQPVPVNVPGELHIGGAGLAHSYLNRPDLTNEKFVPNPFSRDPDSRLYKTGDKCRYLSDGNIEFLGRIDHQVKIRGFRIELGEIEAILSQHEQIQESVVIAREDQSGNKQLAAYFTPEEENPPDINDLREFLKAKLPDYMIPAFFVFMDALPLTPNGKIDRKALPAPDPNLMREHKFAAPGNETEKRIAEIWKKVLNLEKVSINDNFFEVGGNSLISVAFAGKIEKQFNIPIPISAIFENPTIIQMSKLLQNGKRAAFSPLVKIQTRGEGNPFFCVHPVGGTVICYNDLANSLDAVRPFYGLQSSGMNKGEKIFTSIEDMAACYIDALLSVQRQGPYNIGGWSLGGVIAFEIAQQLQEAGHEVAMLVLIDSHTPGLLSEFEKKTGKKDDDLFMMLKDLEGLLGDKIPLQVKELKQPDKDARPDRILKKVSDSGVMPSGMNFEQMKRLFSVFKVNRKAMNNYKPGHYSGRTILFASAEKPVKIKDAAQGWGEFISQDNLYTRQIPGDHYTMLHKPDVSIMAEEMNRLLVKRK